MNKSEKRSTSHGTVGAVMGLLSRNGPEAPPGVVHKPVSALPWPNFGEEPTQLLPIIPPRTVPGTPAAPDAAAAKPKVEARAVIVYQPEPRRSWGLWVLTAVLVALTVGVVLGQTVADQTGSKSVAAARTEPAYSTPPQVAPSPSDQALPVTGQRVTAPLGTAKTRQLEVLGGSTLVKVRSVDLGKLLFNIATLDSSAVPKVVNTDSGPRVELVRTGALGTVGAEIQLNSRVKWTVRLTGGSAQQEIDMRAGGLAAVDLVGGASRAVLQLPKPTGTVPLSITGGVSDMTIQAGPGVPVRLRLGKGAESAIIDGTAHQRVKSGTALTSYGWTGTTNRYDISASAKVDAVQVEHS